MNSGTNGYTPTQQRIWNVLKDGYPHSYHELFSCLADPEGAAIDRTAGRAVLQNMIKDLRKKMPTDLIIDQVCVGYSRCYRLARHISLGE